jgi:hypothetical protein
MIGIDCTDHLQWRLFLHCLPEGRTGGILAHVCTFMDYKLFCG